MCFSSPGTPHPQPWHPVPQANSPPEKAQPPNNRKPTPLRPLQTRGNGFTSSTLDPTPTSMRGARGPHPRHPCLPRQHLVSLVREVPALTTKRASTKADLSSLLTSGPAVALPLRQHASPARPPAAPQDPPPPPQRQQTSTKAPNISFAQVASTNA